MMQKQQEKSLLSSILFSYIFVICFICVAAADTEVRQPLLEVSVSDTDLQLCETAAVLGLSGSVGVLQARMHSQGNKARAAESVNQLYSLVR